MPLCSCNITLYVMLILEAYIHAGAGCDEGYNCCRPERLPEPRLANNLLTVIPDPTLRGPIALTVPSILVVLLLNGGLLPPS